MVYARTTGRTRAHARGLQGADQDLADPLSKRTLAGQIQVLLGFLQELAVRDQECIKIYQKNISHIIFYVFHKPLIKNQSIRACLCIRARGGCIQTAVGQMKKMIFDHF